MCNLLTSLVQHSIHRQTARCEHGTLHLSWHAVTWSLSSHDFARLFAFVQVARLTGQPQLEAEPLVFVRGHAENVTLWFGPAGLAFNAEDFRAFYELLYSTHLRLLQGQLWPDWQILNSPFASNLN